jgi:hypothetical protein
LKNPPSEGTGAYKGRLLKLTEATRVWLSPGKVSGTAPRFFNKSSIYLFPRTDQMNIRLVRNRNDKRVWQVCSVCGIQYSPSNPLFPGVHSPLAYQLLKAKCHDAKCREEHEMSTDKKQNSKKHETRIQNDPVLLCLDDRGDSLRERLEHPSLRQSR